MIYLRSDIWGLKRSLCYYDEKVVLNVVVFFFFSHPDHNAMGWGGIITVMGAATITVQVAVFSS